MGAGALRLAELADARRPWPPELLTELVQAAGATVDWVAARDVDHDTVVASILRGVARDLLEVIELPALAE